MSNMKSSKMCIVISGTKKVRAVCRRDRDVFRKQIVKQSSFEHCKHHNIKKTRIKIDNGHGLSEEEPRPG